MDVPQFIVRHEDLKQAQEADSVSGNMFIVQTSPEKKAISVNVQLQRMNFEQRTRGFNKCSGGRIGDSSTSGISNLAF